MRKCPKCNADIQENARFCLYCMTSFEEKLSIETLPPPRRWRYILAAVAAVAVLLCAVLLVARNQPTDDAPVSTTVFTTSTTKNGATQAFGTDASSEVNITADSTTATDENGKTQAVDTSVSGVNGLQATTAKTDGDTRTDGRTVGNTAATTGAKPTVGTTTVGNTAKTTAKNPTKSTTKPSTATTTKTTASTTGTQPQYSYVTATIENTYAPWYSPLSAPYNAVVITGVHYQEASGNYVIPDTIDGKKVAGLMPTAFSDAAVAASVKTITLPESAKIIWNDALAQCVNLTDLYIKSGFMEIYTDAFPAVSARNGQLTIHCKKDCKNSNFYYYRNIADTYGAIYQEWNG